MAITALRRVCVLAALASCSPLSIRDAAPDAIDAHCDIDSTTPAPGTCPVLGHDWSACMDLIVGTGRDGTFDDFAALVPGQTVWVEPGEQGLQHIVFAFRGTGFDPTLALLQVHIVDASNCNEVGSLRTRLPFVPDPADPSRLALPALRVVLADDANPYEYCTILGRDITAVVDLDDAHGHAAHREVGLHVGGIDPSARPDIRAAWIAHCGGADAGHDAGSEGGP
jgi:hypothetical protein